VFCADVRCSAVEPPQYGERALPAAIDIGFAEAEVDRLADQRSGRSVALQGSAAEPLHLLLGQLYLQPDHDDMIACIAIMMVSPRYGLGRPRRLAGCRPPPRAPPGPVLASPRHESRVSCAVAPEGPPLDYESFLTPGLGDNSYLARSGGEAVLIDPQRDAWRFLSTVGASGVSLRWVVETHVHNDYLSGALEVAAATGVEVAGPAGAGYRWDHRGLREGDEIRVGRLRLVALETPGHTPEHLAYLVYEDGSTDPVALFSGGSLMVGSAGRTDLLGEARTEELTRAQFRSLRRLAGLHEGVLLLPTHGAGSFCAASASEERRTSTIGAELRSNPALQPVDEESFLRRQLTGLLDFPTYYREMAPINRAGPALLHRLPELPALSPADIERLTEAGAWLVDVRDRAQFAGCHIAGAVNIELDESFASYVGWTVPFGARIALVLPDRSAAAEASVQLLRIGYESLAGYLAGGMEAWLSAGLPVRSYPVAGVEDLRRASRAGRAMTVLDVRQRQEWDEGHIPGSRHLFFGELPGRIGEVPSDVETWVICAKGPRAAIGASLLDRAGIPVRLVARGGVPDWKEERSLRPAHGSGGGGQRRHAVEEERQPVAGAARRAPQAHVAEQGDPVGGGEEAEEPHRPG
jgi:hydroxyacylglutathione hydrolase